MSQNSKPPSNDQCTQPQNHNNNSNTSEEKDFLNGDKTLYRDMNIPASALASADPTLNVDEPVVYRSVLGLNNNHAIHPHQHSAMQNAFSMAPPSFNKQGLGMFGMGAASTVQAGLNGKMAFYDEPLDMSKASISGTEEQELNNNFEPVPEVPSYVEKYTTFASRSFPNDILRKVMEILRSFSTVDYELNAPLYQINGTVYENYASANFRVNLFKKEKERAYLVEFQRRSGDAMLFNSFFRFVKSKSADILEDQAAAVAAAQPVNKFTPPSYDLLLEAETLSPLQSMAESQYVDVAREGMKMLAKCSTTSDNHQVLAKMLDLVLKHFTSKDEELTRYSAFILANLTKTEAVCTRLIKEQTVEPLFAQLKATENREVSRQLAQILVNVSEVDSESLRRQEYVSTLRQLSNSSNDTKFKSLVQATLARVDM